MAARYRLSLGWEMTAEMASISGSVKRLGKS
jgi:hypothetical protein